MESSLTVHLSEALRRRTYKLAAARGETVENVVRKAVESYISVAESAGIFKPEELASPSELGERLRELRTQVITSGVPLLDWEDLHRELAECRGERNLDEADLH